ncbi:hypothetical protein BCR44DRAFT_1423533, partial [Catenaria anguillulae PL171]
MQACHFPPAVYKPVALQHQTVVTRTPTAKTGKGCWPINAASCFHALRRLAVAAKRRRQRPHRPTITSLSARGSCLWHRCSNGLALRPRRATCRRPMTCSSWPVGEEEAMENMACSPFFDLWNFNLFASMASTWWNTTASGLARHPR